MKLLTTLVMAQMIDDGNMKSIAIEICVNADGNFEKAKANAVELIKHLMNEHSIPISNVVPHQKWSGKYARAIFLAADGATSYPELKGVPRCLIYLLMEQHLKMVRMDAM